MKTLRTIILILIAAIGGFLLYVSTLPDEFRFSRSITINAPVDVIFPYADNLRQFNAWNPWAELDPKAKNTFEGPEAGVGASVSWDGNSDVGKGSMTSIESLPGQRVRYAMKFLEPMESESTAEFTFEPEGDATKVSWSMFGESNLIAKAIGVMMDCETMVGEQFDKGLAKLKALAEADAQKAAEAPKDAQEPAAADEKTEE